MPKRFYGQRQHIIHSLDTLLYQLHTLSFFLSPSLWLFLLRIACQFQYSKPRERDSNHSLRFYLAMVVVFGMPSILSHLIYGASEGRALILDFIGIAQTPSKAQLCFLDLVIVFLQCILLTIAYETSVYFNEDESAQDFLLQNDVDARPPPQLTPLGVAFPIKPSNNDGEPPLVVDLHIGAFQAHFTSPPSPSLANHGSGLPMPNTTPWPIPSGVRMFMRANRPPRERRRDSETNPLERRGRDQRLPGGMDDAE